ncbi:MAG: hypothetical protein DRI81_07200 [Chloroflexi bacterium]|nr:MAG: hypothetical protein DRI81_07200 [Chloroflexota bacterium]
MTNLAIYETTPSGLKQQVIPGVEPLPTPQARPGLDDLLARMEKTYNPFDLIETSNRADTTKYTYRRSLEKFYAWGGRLSNAHSLTEYAQTLSNSNKLIFRSAVAAWSGSIILKMQTGADVDNVQYITAAKERFEAVNQALKTKPTTGEKSHSWLSENQVHELLTGCDISTLTGRRDRLVLAIGLSCGLRRAEMAALTWAAIVNKPAGLTFNVLGKGDKSRPVPVSAYLVGLLSDWEQAVGRTGQILRSVDKGGNLGASITGAAIAVIVGRHGKRIGLPTLAAHDMRRSFAQRLYTTTKDIFLVQRMLGHASAETTQRYLDLETLDDRAAIDHLWNGALSE